MEEDPLRIPESHPTSAPHCRNTKIARPPIGHNLRQPPWAPRPPPTPTLHVARLALPSKKNSRAAGSAHGCELDPVTVRDPVSAAALLHSSAGQTASGDITALAERMDFRPPTCCAQPPHHPTPPIYTLCMPAAGSRLAFLHQAATRSNRRIAALRFQRRK